jgi:NAD(P)-dependent dehydrogenase (short-subunit alcohol dehydrogenase family)
LLVNNAGIALSGEQPRRTSADGYELQFAVNYLAGWVLVNTLRPNLAAAAPSRVINVASGSAHAIDFDDVMLEQPGAHARGYGQSKLAQVSMTVELAPMFAEEGITMISLHPATLMNTTMVESLGIPPRATVAEGRDHVMGLITRPDLEPGTFYVAGKPVVPRDPQPGDASARARLVALSEALTGVPADQPSR